jgi:hypothetical protein
MRDLLRLWVAARALIPIVMIVLMVDVLGDMAARALMLLPYPHGVVKWGLESSQGLLLRHHQLPWFALATGGAALVLSMLRGRAWSVGAVVLLVAGMFAPRFGTWPLLVVTALVMLAGAPLAWLTAHRDRARIVAWIPGSTVLVPSVVAVALGSGARPWVHRLLVTVLGAGLGVGGVWLDCLASYPHVRAGMEAWPDAHLDPRIRVLAQSEPGVRADWHGVRVTGDRAVVAAETTTRLLSFSLDPGGPTAEFDLKPRWGPESAAPVDVETDPETGLTWVVDGGQHLREVAYNDGAWRIQRTLRLPQAMSYAYFRRTETGRFILASVQLSGPNPRLVTVGTLPALDDLHAVHLRATEGELPMPREVEWVPSIDRLVLAPDFGGRLYLADLDSGEATPWLEMPTLDGKMRWSKDLDRLVLALPNRTEMWVVDPHTGAIDWTIPTQPGVRALAIDDSRGLVVSASVLTGQILVQDLRTGEVLDRLGTVMPMVRELALAPDRGQAVLTTWAAVYTFPYAAPR